MFLRPPGLLLPPPRPLRLVVRPLGTLRAGHRPRGPLPRGGALPGGPLASAVSATGPLRGPPITARLIAPPIPAWPVTSVKARLVAALIRVRLVAGGTARLMVPLVTARPLAPLVAIPAFARALLRPGRREDHRLVCAFPAWPGGPRSAGPRLTFPVSPLEMLGGEITGRPRRGR
ncbi:hypothetical protein AB1484_15525 [Parafrankia sp. FMc6]|uniref:hypothetical protein n=1 Tax=Parafrankia soli TaxID=2599596 RepID=UPI0034D7A7EC